MKINKIELIKENLKYPNKPLLPDNIKQDSGVYLLYDNKLNLIYIGKTSQLRTRLLAHISPRIHNRPSLSDFPGENRCNWGEYAYASIIPKEIKIKYYSFFKEESEKERDLIELLLIKFLSPELNYNGFFTKKGNKSQRENKN